MSLHADALASLEGWRAPDEGQEAQRRRYVAHLAAHPDGVFRRNIPDHLTASAVVLDGSGDHVLLTLHAKAGLWFQLGGHCEESDTTLAGAAYREAVEESGIDATRLRVDPVPVQLSPHPVPFCRPTGLADGAIVHHLDVRYLVVADALVDPEVSEESLDVRWWPVDALPDPEPELVAAVSLARRRLAQAPVSASSSGSASSGGGSTLLAADHPSR
ncbi:MAG TPA: NUDIX domain-containing protein [Nocardioides sp.]